MLCEPRFAASFHATAKAQGACIVAKLRGYDVQDEKTQSLILCPVRLAIPQCNYSAFQHVWMCD